MGRDEGGQGLDPGGDVLRDGRGALEPAADLGLVAAGAAGEFALGPADDDEAAGSIAQVLGSMGHVCRVLHFKEPVNSVLTPQTKLALLVMREASELGFGVAIKISSAGMPMRS